MNHKAIFAMLFLSLLMLPLVSAGVTNIGTFKLGECVSLRQTCADCTYNYITKVTMPDSTAGISGTLLMDKVGTYYNYTFCNTSQAGDYIVDGYGDLGATTPTVWNYYFTVTATGADSSTGQSMTYIFLFVFCLIIFAVLLFIGLSAPGGNKTDEMTGYILAVSNVKYVKITCLGFSWIFGVFLAYLSWMLSFAYLDFSFLTDVFHWIFYAMAALTLPFFILFVYFVVANAIRDSKISEALSRGFQVNPAGLPT